MRRLGAIAALVLSFVMVTAGQALAQYPPSTPPGGGGGGPGAGNAPGGGTDVAFTGTNISLGVMILAALVVIGVFLLVAGRRRVAAAKSG